MRVLTFPLLVLAAPLLVIIRGHFGRRIVWALVVAMMVPFVAAFAEGIVAVITSPRHARVQTLLSPYWRDALNVHAALVMISAPLLVVHVVSLLLPTRVDGVPRNEGSLGSFTAKPVSIVGLVVDWLRLVLVVGYAIAKPDFVREYVSLLLDPARPNGLLVAGATLVVIIIAAMNNGVLPGFARLARSWFPLWRHITRFGPQSKARTGEPLSAILSRRPADLKSIAGG